MRNCLLILLCSMLLFSCESNSIVNPVPNYPVSLEVDIVAEYPALTTANVYSYITFLTPRYPTDRIGYAGVMLYVAGDMTYHAFDLCCPHCLDATKPIIPDDPKYQPKKVGSCMYAKCPTCGEEYDLSFGLGMPTKGIAENYLRAYRVMHNNGKLIIYN